MQKMQKKEDTIKEVPIELKELLIKDAEALEFFDSLAPSHKKAYNDWVGSAKQESTRKTRAEKALLMLRNKQKTLKIV
jgi:uncharacterized protein YdeI (YjbR/CyaY-like superfamily)